MTFEELLVGVGEKVGARIEAQGDLCVVEVDGRPVIMRHFPETFELLVFAEIGSPSPDVETNMMRTALAGNHLFVATAGATLSRNAETGRFCLARRDMIDVLPFERWWTAFGQFLEVLANWRNFVVNGQAPAGQMAETDPDAAEDETILSGGGNLPQLWA